VLRDRKARTQEETGNHHNIYLIVGLGNPGIEYTDTRHNLGFKAVDLFCHKLNLHLSDHRFQALSTTTMYHGKKVVIACPQTFMNRSGFAVRYLVEHHGPELSDVLVVHDDIDIEAGRIKIVRAGGAGGHRGAESIISDLGTDRFNRVKVGIGRPRHGESIEDFVLSPPYGDQEKLIKDILYSIIEIIELFIMEGVESVMSKFNALVMRGKEV